MTDLEGLWDDYPTGKPPVDAVLRDARRAQMAAAAAADAEVRRQRTDARRRLLTKPLVTAGVVTGMVGAFVGGTLVGGGGPTTAGSGVDQLPTPAAFSADLTPAQSCDELLEVFQDRSLEYVGSHGWGDGGYDELDDLDAISRDGAFLVEQQYADRMAVEDSVAGDMPSADLTQSREVRAPEVKGAYNSETGTNVQEAGVDEPDTVKTDTEHLYRLRDDELVVYDLTGDHVARAGSVDLPGLEDAEMLLSGDTVVAIGADDDSPRERARTRVMTVSVADPEKPEVTDDLTYDGWVMSARQHGSAIRLVLTSGLPTLDFVEPGGEVSMTEATEKNRQVLRDSTIEEWLPTVRVAGEDGDDAAPLVDCTNVAVPSDDLSLDRVSIVGFDAADPTALRAIGLAGTTNVAYESTDRLFLAATPRLAGCWDCFSRALPADDGNTYLFEFALDGTTTTHVASGEVEGAIDDRWAMDAADGTLRLALTPTEQTGDFTSVVTMRSQNEDLVEVGRLDRLGIDEDLKSVRWFDGLAILVTFRQVDPLYAVDLTDAARPRLMGELKIPGFSSYLHPLGPDRIIGVGEGPGENGRWGAQAALFNTADLGDVRRLATTGFGPGTEALAGTDPRSFTWLPGPRVALTVVSRYRGAREGLLEIMRLVDGRFETESRLVEYGDDVDVVRTVPVGEGRVVLVTGENVEFLDIG